MKLLAKIGQRELSDMRPRAVITDEADMLDLQALIGFVALADTCLDQGYAITLLIARRWGPVFWLGQVNAPESRELHQLKLPDIAPEMIVAIFEQWGAPIAASEQPVKIGKSDFCKKDLQSMEALTANVQPAEWVDFLEEFRLRKIGNFLLADEIGLLVSRLKSFRILVKGLAAANQIADDKKKLAERMVKQIEMLSSRFNSTRIPDNEAQNALSALLKEQAKLAALREYKPSSAPGRRS